MKNTGVTMDRTHEPKLSTSFNDKNVSVSKMVKKSIKTEQIRRKLYQTYKKNGIILSI